MRPQVLAPFANSYDLRCRPRNTGNEKCRRNALDLDVETDMARVVNLTYTGLQATELDSFEVSAWHSRARSIIGFHGFVAAFGSAKPNAVGGRYSYLVAKIRIKPY